MRLGNIAHALRARTPRASHGYLARAGLERATLCIATLLLLSSPITAQAQDHNHHHSDDATVQHRFENAQDWAKRFEDPERDAWQLPQQVVEALCTREDLIIADIGSATGYFPVRFARACPQGLILGADIEPDMVRYLNDRARAEGLNNLVSILAGTQSPHLPMAVDLVFICNTYHHIDSRVEYFARLKEHLRAGGRVAVVDYRPESHRGPAHKLAAEVVVREMGQAGYALLEAPDFLPEQYFLVFGPAS